MYRGRVYVGRESAVESFEQKRGTIEWSGKFERIESKDESRTTVSFH